MSASSYAAARLIRALPRVTLSKAVGRLCEQPLPAPLSSLVQRTFCAAYDVQMAEAEHSGPFPTFDAFFTRALRQGARPIASSEIVSPADGKLSARGSIDPGARIFVKKQVYDVGELTGDATEGRRYSGGSFGVIYLAPHNYHRVHSPVAGKIQLVRGIAGDLYPVNAIGEAHIDGLFVRNHRACICIDSEALGRVSVVMVGATIVGRISVSVVPEPAVPIGTTKMDPAPSVERGEEIGMFHLGSTAVVLFEPGVSIDRDVGPVRMGESLLRES